MLICFTLRASLKNRSFARHVGLYEAGDVQGLLEAAGFQGIRALCSADRHREFVRLTARRGEA